MDWIQFDDGASVGQVGSEDGTILRDEEHVDGARITLEGDGTIAPFSITSGVGGWMVHTSFLGTRREAETEFDRMKTELASILRLIPLESDPDVESKLVPVIDAIADFVEKHP